MIIVSVGMIERILTRQYAIRNILVIRNRITFEKSKFCNDNFYLN